MSYLSSTATTQPEYYVPEQSYLPIFASVGLFVTVFGIAHWINGHQSLVFWVGFLSFIGILYRWFSTVIKEHLDGCNSHKLQQSYVWAMGWFIFSEVMFFAAFFGALFYVRNFAVPWLAGEGTHDSGTTHSLLWPNFTAEWPVMVTPDAAQAEDKATFMGPEHNMSFASTPNPLAWLPLWNTLILLSSSVTVHIAHHALKHNQRRRFHQWLGATVGLGFLFVVLQIIEYYEAYHHMGLTLNSGIYGTTFFLLTGFHGLHVTLGALMLGIMLARSVLKHHFKPNDCFGFEASSWYWHFVDIVWVGLFIFVYII